MKANPLLSLLLFFLSLSSKRVDGAVLSNILISERNGNYPSVRLIVAQTEDNVSRNMFFQYDDDDYLVHQSSMMINHPTYLVMKYTKIMAAVTSIITPVPKRILNVGMGGNCLPRWFFNNYRTGRVTTVEIDPVVVEISEEYFPTCFTEEEGACYHDLVISSMRDFFSSSIRESPDSCSPIDDDIYDCIWMDVCSLYDDPGIITPKEIWDTDFMKEVKENFLTEDGISIANVFDKSGNGPNAYCRAFDYCLVIRFKKTKNFVLVGSDRSVTCDQIRSSPYWETEKTRMDDIVKSCVRS